MLAKYCFSMGDGTENPFFSHCGLANVPSVEFGFHGQGILHTPPCPRRWKLEMLVQRQIGLASNIEDIRGHGKSRPFLMTSYGIHYPLTMEMPFSFSGQTRENFVHFSSEPLRIQVRSSEFLPKQQESTLNTISIPIKAPLSLSLLQKAMSE